MHICALCSPQRDGPSNFTHKIRDTFRCSFSKVIQAIMCQQWLFAFYAGQTSQSLQKRINGHNFDTPNKNKIISAPFNLPGLQGRFENSWFWQSFTNTIKQQIAECTYTVYKVFTLSKKIPKNTIFLTNLLLFMDKTVIICSHTESFDWEWWP